MSKVFLKTKTRCRNKGDTLPSNTVTSTDLHVGGGGGTVANKQAVPVAVTVTTLKIFI